MMMEQKFVRRRQIPQRFNAEKNVSSRTHTRRSSNDNKMNFIALQGICLRLCPFPECVGKGKLSDRGIRVLPSSARAW